MNDDFRDALVALIDAGARFLVVGAHAMAVHGVPRATGDIDLWISPDPANAQRVWEALQRFGAPIASLGLTERSLTEPDAVIQIGMPPRRIDLLTSLSGVDFEAAWGSRVVHRVGSLEIPFIGRQPLIENKQATGRAKDLADLETLERG